MPGSCGTRLAFAAAHLLQARRSSPGACASRLPRRMRSSTSSPIGVSPSRARSSAALWSARPFIATTMSRSRSPACSAASPAGRRRPATPSSEATPSFFAISGLRSRHLDAEAAAAHFAELHDLVEDRARHVRRHGEADADVAAGRADDRGVDPDQLAAQVHERAAGVARVDRGVGLDEVLVAFGREPAAAERADDAGGDGLPDAERIADRDHVVADAAAGRNRRSAARSRSRASICSTAMSVPGSEPTRRAWNCRRSFSVTSTCSALRMTWWLVST